MATALQRFRRLLDNQSLPTPGEVLYSNQKYTALRKAYENITTLEEKATFFGTQLPGATVMGEMTSGEDVIKRFRELNSWILGHQSNIPGGDFGLGYQPQWHFNSLQEAFMSNSQVLTSADLSAVNKFAVHGGALAKVLLQQTYTRKGECTQIHVPMLVIPDDPRDGPGFFVETIWNMQFVEQADKDVAAKVFGAVHKSFRTAKDPQSIFEKMHASKPSNGQLGIQDMVWTGPFSPAGLMLAEVSPDAYHFQREDQTMYPTQGVMDIRLTKDEHQKAARVHQFIRLSHQKGAPASNGAHYGGNSCVNTIARSLICDEVAAGIKPNDPLHKVLMALINKAQYLYWTDAKTHNAEDTILQPQVFPRVDKETFSENVFQLLIQRSMTHGKKSGFEGEIGFVTHYCMTDKPHPNPDARWLCEEACKTALALLEKMKAEIQESERHF